MPEAVAIGVRFPYHSETMLVPPNSEDTKDYGFNELLALEENRKKGRETKPTLLISAKTKSSVFYFPYFIVFLFFLN